MSLTSKTVTVKNTNTTDNYGAGLMILARGAVTINHLTSIFSHGSYGLYIDNWFGSVNPITIQNTLGNNVVNNNVTGVYLASYGNISVTGLSAKFNINYGAYIDNTFTNGSTRGTVSIKDSQFSENDTYGLQVLSRNSITLNNVKANNNYGEYGALLDNQLEAGRAVTVNKSTFDGNYTYGLSIQGGGTVTLNNVSASDNMFDTGLYIDNTYQGVYNVSILSTYGANQFNNNGFVGAWIDTFGNINISKASANNNANTGFIIYNYGTGKSLTMTCSLADGNLWGLAVFNTGGTYPVYLKGTSFIGNAVNDIWSGGTGDTLLYFTRVNCP
jgi:putative surface-exposed virulence protein